MLSLLWEWSWVQSRGSSTSWLNSTPWNNYFHVETFSSFWFISDIWFKKPTCFTFIFNASSGYDWVQNNEVFLTGATYSRNFRKIWILLIRPQGDWVQIALSGGIRSERQLQNSKHFLWKTCLLSSGSEIVINSPSLSFLDWVE